MEAGERSHPGAGRFTGLPIGVLALQGAFAEHVAALGGLGAVAREVRLPQHLEGLEGLVIPGGESTAIGKLLVDFGLLEPLRARLAHGLPAWGTCAGAILLAREVGGGQPLLGGLDISVERNAFGRQLQSFEADLAVPGVGGPPFRAVFVRAPAIRAVGPGVEPLARLPDGTVVAARGGHLLATCFHPELTGDARFHRYFLRMVEEARGGPGMRRAASG